MCAVGIEHFLSAAKKYERGKASKLRCSASGDSSFVGMTALMELLVVQHYTNTKFPITQKLP
jgi:hypothetical protein